MHIRYAVKTLQPYRPGQTLHDLERFGLTSCVKMGSNENPLGAAPVVREAIVTEDVAPTGTTQAYRQAKREPPSVAADWISDDINAGKWQGYQPPPLPER